MWVKGLRAKGGIWPQKGRLVWFLNPGAYCQGREEERRWPGRTETRDEKASTLLNSTHMP